MLRDSWVLDENGLTCRLDSNGQLVHSVWIEEDGRWKYVDEFGHMVTSASKTIDGVQYVFDAYGYMEEKEKAAQPYWTLSGNRYVNQWADITLSFPETAQVEMGMILTVMLWRAEKICFTGLTRYQWIPDHSGVY